MIRRDPIGVVYRAVMMAAWSAGAGTAQDWCTTLTFAALAGIDFMDCRKQGACMVLMFYRDLHACHTAPAIYNV